MRPAATRPFAARRRSRVLLGSLAILAFALRGNAGTLSETAPSTAAPLDVVYEFSAVAASSEQTPSIDLDDAVDARLAVELDEGRSVADVRVVLLGRYSRQFVGSTRRTTRARVVGGRRCGSRNIL